MSGEDLTQRVQSLEREMRAGHYTVTREVAVERQITRDLVEALHIRVDRFEAAVMRELGEIKGLLTRNGHG